MSGVREGRFRLLYVSPERLVGEGADVFLGRVASGAAPVRFVAIDEAHCISQWGHDFRPEYRQLGRLRELFPGVSLHAYTATATARVRQRHHRAARPAQPGRCWSALRPAQPDLPRRAAQRRSRSRSSTSSTATAARPASSTASRARTSIELAAWLRRRGRQARCAYHAGLSDEERHRHQDAFLDEQADVVVATVAFGMGIDRSNVRFVAPRRRCRKSVEHYQQETGRAGRDGLEAECVLVVSAADFLKWRQMLEPQRRADRAAPDAAARHGALRRRGRLPAPSPGALLRRALRQGRLRRLRLLPGRARGGRRRR